MPGGAEILRRCGRSLKNPAWVSFAWFGMSAGISFLATPARFTAPTATREVALDVGRAVFEALGKAEFVALILLLVLVRISGRAREFLLACSALAAIMIAQAVWLLPALSARTQQIVEGIEPAPSIDHAAFSLLQLVKLGLLLYIGVRAMGGTERIRA